MNNYETIMIINPTLTEEETQNTIQKIEELIKSNGTLNNTEIWGKRKLAYPIQKHNEGVYILIDFNSDADFIDELKTEVIDYITEIWNEVYNLQSRDDMFDNTLSEHIVFECDSLTRTLDKARRRLDELNGHDSGNYPWA